MNTNQSTSTTNLSENFHMMPVGVRIPISVMSMIDDMRRVLPDLPTRQDMIRRLLETDIPGASEMRMEIGVRGESVALNIRLSGPLIDRIDNLRRLEKEVPSRPEMIRRMIAARLPQ